MQNSSRVQERLPRWCSRDITTTLKQSVRTRSPLSTWGMLSPRRADRYVADPGPLIPWHRRSSMTRKLTRNTGVLRGIAPLIAVLTVTIALAALAQTKGASRPSGRSYDVFVVPDVRSAERATASALQAKHSDTP